jgi:hypothetical protein
MLKKNYLFILSIAILLVFITFLFYQNSKLKREFISQKKENSIQLKKLNEYDSITFSLKNILTYFSDDNFDSLSGFELTKKLAFSLNLSKNATNNASKNFSNFKYDSKYFNQNTIDQNIISLKNINDSIVSLLKIANITNDSLSYKLKHAKDLLVNSRKDTLSIKNPNNVALFYFGNLERKAANGFGIGFYKKKGFYIGNWSHNLREGFGKHHYINGDIYIGDFMNDKREGFGVYYYETGDKFEGEWKNDLMNGKGKITLKNGTKKDGFWIDGKIKKN